MRVVLFFFLILKTFLMSFIQVLFIAFGVVFVPYVLSDGLQTLRELFNDAKK